MDRSDLDAEIRAAEQELSALLEKHINTPMQQHIEDVSGGLSLTLKEYLESSIRSLRSELKSLNSAFEDFRDDLDSARQESRRIETLIKQVEGIQKGQFDTTHAQIIESGCLVAKGIADAEARLEKLGTTQLHRLNAELEDLMANIRASRIENGEVQERLLGKLDTIQGTIVALDAQTRDMQRVSGQRFIGACVALGTCLAGVAALLVKVFL